MQVHYKNLLSRFLFERSFKNQWVIPRMPASLLRLFFSGYEKLFVRPDFSKQKIDRPIFIISQPRSGSSMLQDVLSAHTDMAYITNMMHVFSPCYCGAEMFRRQLSLDIEGERFLKDSVMINGGTPADPVAVWNRWYRLNSASLDYNELSLQDFAENEIEQIFHEIHQVLWCFKPEGGGRFLSKNPGLLPYMRLTSELFPDARFIYLVRDPRQNANSMCKLYRLCETQRKQLPWDEPELIPYPRLPRLGEYIREFGPDSLEATARLWRDSVQFMQSWEGAPNVCRIRYEDILAAPQESLQEILSFCELSSTGADNSLFQQRLESIGKIHHRNTSYDGFERIQEICKEEMGLLGYS